MFGLAFFRFLSVRSVSAMVMALAVGCTSLAVGAEGTSPAKALPSGAYGYVELKNLDGLLDRIQNPDILRVISDMPAYRQLEKSPNYNKVLAGLKIVETQLGMDAWALGRALFGQVVGVAAYPKEDRSVDVVVLLKSLDPKVVAQLRERIDPFITLAGDQVEILESAPGQKAYAFQKKVFVAWGDTWVAGSSSAELFNKTLALLAGKAQGALADDAPYQSMSRQMGDSHLLRTYANLAALSEKKGGRLVPDKLDNALVSLFAGGIAELAAKSPYAGLTLDVEENRFVITTGISGDVRQLDEAHRVFAPDPGAPGAAPIPKLPNLIAGFTMWRDFAGWYQQREKLLVPRLLPGFDAFETGISNILPGKDVGTDILPLLGKSITLVAAPQDYSNLDGQPGMKLPGFGLIVDLAKPAEGADVFQMLFQTVTALLNTQAGQQKRQPWVITSETYKGVQVSYGRYLKKPTGDNLPVVYNFTPAAALVGKNFVICTSLGTCRQLIDELQKPVSASADPKDSRGLEIELHADALADILWANSSLFHARAVQGGRTEQQARQDFDTQLFILHVFQTFRLTSVSKPDAVQIQLEGSWK